MAVVATYQVGAATVRYHDDHYAPDQAAAWKRAREVCAAPYWRQERERIERERQAREQAAAIRVSEANRAPEIGQSPMKREVCAQTKCRAQTVTQK